MKKIDPEKRYLLHQLTSITGLNIDGNLMLGAGKK